MNIDDEMIQDCLQATRVHANFRYAMSTLNDFLESGVDENSQQDQLKIDVRLGILRKSIDILNAFDEKYSKRKATWFSTQHTYAKQSLEQNLPSQYKDQFADYLA